MNESNWLETVKNLVSEKKALQTPTVTCGSSAERQWWPPYVVATQPKQEE